MLHLNNLTTINTFQSGLSYVGTASFEGKTVKEVLEEIKYFSKDKNASYLGEGFGNKLSKGGDAWGITITYRYGYFGEKDSKGYLGSWVGWKSAYNHEYDDYLVTQVKVSGGWHCFYDFEIKCKNQIKNKIV